VGSDSYRKDAADFPKTCAVCRTWHPAAGACRASDDVFMKGRDVVMNGQMGEDA